MNTRSRRPASQRPMQFTRRQPRDPSDPLDDCDWSSGWQSPSGVLALWECEPGAYEGDHPATIARLKEIDRL